jgi:hypothetical protein
VNKLNLWEKFSAVGIAAFVKIIFSTGSLGASYGSEEGKEWKLLDCY